MQYSTFFLAALPVVLAQYGDSSSGGSSSSAGASPASTASAMKGVQTVLVGSPEVLSITPNNIKAEVGTVVEFVFYPKTHSVAQSSFAEPCAPMANGTGFFSGPQTTASGKNANVFAITINDTKPIWFYCAFPGHCENGMVGVINAPADGSKTVEQYISAAAKVEKTVAPAKAQGGFLGAAEAVVVPTANANAKNAAAASSVQWGLSISGLLAVAVASLII